MALPEAAAPLSPFNTFLRPETKAPLQIPVQWETVLSDLMAKHPNGSARNRAILPLGLEAQTSGRWPPKPSLPAGW